MKKHISRLITTLLLIIFTLLLSSAAYAAPSDETTGPGVTWVQDTATGNWMFRKNGDFICNDWLQVKGFWYLFDENGFMRTGWAEKDGAFYYLWPNTGNDAQPQGSLIMGCLTPDGYYVDANGVRVSGANPTNPLSDPTCVEVNITQQIVNVYIDNQLLLSTPCVTGRQTADRRTPPGRFGVYNKETERYLQGDNGDGTKYKSYVHYWMPFNGGIGLHDATWRGAFGGDIYVNSGSHGCVNLPLDAAAQIFGVLQVGWPVIVHY